MICKKCKHWRDYSGFALAYALIAELASGIKFTNVCRLKRKPIDNICQDYKHKWKFWA